MWLNREKLSTSLKFGQLYLWNKMETIITSNMHAINLRDTPECLQKLKFEKSTKKNLKSNFHPRFPLYI